MKHFLNGQQGSALLVVLALMVMITMVAMVSADRATEDITLSYNQANIEQAFYMADAGIKHAMVVINDSLDWRTGFVNQTLGAGGYTVAVVDSVTMPALIDTVLLRSTATVFDAISNIEVKIVPKRESPFKYAVFGYERLRMSGNSCTDSYNSDSGTYAETQLAEHGHVGTNGEMWVRDNAYVTGDVIVASGGTFDMDSSATVLGDIITDAPAQETSFIPQSEFDWAQANNSAPAGFSGTGYTYSGDNLTLHENDTLILSTGVYYFNDIRVEKNASIQLAPGAKVEIYLYAHLDMADFTSFNPGGKPGDLNLWGGENSRLRVENDAEFRGTFFGEHATFRMRQSSRVFGSIIVKREELKTDSTADSFGGCFHYDRSLMNYEKGGIEAMTVVAWKEM